MKKYFAPSILGFSLRALLVLLAACGSGGGAERTTAKLWLEENFNTGGFNPSWNESFVREEFYSAKNKPFVNLGGTHGFVLHYHIPSGQNEFTPAQVGIFGSEAFTKATGRASVEESYVEWEEFFPAEHDFADGAQKLLRLTGYYPGEAPGAEVNLIASGSNSNLQLSVIHPGNNTQPIDLFKNTGLSLPTARWVKLAVWVKLNTPGKEDGFARAYLDGNEIVNLRQASLRGQDQRGWNVLWIGGTHSNGAGKLTRKESSRYIDNIRWYNTLP